MKQTVAQPRLALSPTGRSAKLDPGHACSNGRGAPS